MHALDWSPLLIQSTPAHPVHPACQVDSSCPRSFSQFSATEAASPSPPAHPTSLSLFDLHATSIPLLPTSHPTTLPLPPSFLPTTIPSLSTSPPPPHL
ncbi:uncharacterized protein SCHCODRAFT_02624736 [Schizophyllum commune H4-8]|uniref:uncharacterized protein n=1 Tax=Schizophyllum commune (strain H4-8 / FGSC 9210) TaxID=578458 RepID=UPI00215EF9DD|nr:uncharacterized protein SCHCODRAFT_02624736 [Schizophyllum commune H4-8]KAI5891881.1 hypothetical protein SCHCODRAFT_02624736 [Schizophyllum commune H4-8]